MVTSGARRRRVATGLLLLGGLLGAACGDSGGEEGGAGTTTGGGENDTTTTALGGGGFDPSVPVRFGYTIAPTSWDPHLATSAGGVHPYMALVYDSLLQVDQNGEIQPMLASAYEVAEDSLSVTLTIREGVSFQDGATLDAQVVVDNLDRASGDPDSTVANQYANVTEVAATGTNEVTLTLGAPDPALLYSLASPTAGAIISPNVLGDPSVQQEPVGAGPYRLVSVDPTTARYEFFEDYWDTSREFPEQREIFGAVESDALFNALETDVVDWIVVSGDSVERAEDLVATGEYEMHERPGVSVVTLFLNTNLAPVDDIDVRRAISLAIDRQAAADAAAPGGCTATNQPFPADSPYHNDDPEHEIRYDPDEARELLGGQEITIPAIVSIFEPPASISVIVQQMLAEVGVDLEITSVPATDTIPTFSAGDTVAAGHQGTLTNIDPSTFMEYVTGRFNPSDLDAELVDMVDTARLLPVGSEERTEAYQEIGGYLADNPVNIPICGRRTLYLGRTGLVGFDDLPVTGASLVDPRNVVAVQ